MIIHSVDHCIFFKRLESFESHFLCGRYSKAGVSLLIEPLFKSQNSLGLSEIPLVLFWSVTRIAGEDALAVLHFSAALLLLLLLLHVCT